MKVSNSKENAMLNTVKMLRRLLRNAFFVTNRVSVIKQLREKVRAVEKSAGNSAGPTKKIRPSPTSIVDAAYFRQSDRIALLTLYAGSFAGFFARSLEKTAAIDVVLCFAF